VIYCCNQYSRNLSVVNNGLGSFGDANPRRLLIIDFPNNTRTNDARETQYAASLLVTDGIV
jgi:hypothetical protein